MERSTWSLGLAWLALACAVGCLLQLAWWGPMQPLALGHNGAWGWLLGLAWAASTAWVGQSAMGSSPFPQVRTFLVAVTLACTGVVLAAAVSPHAMHLVLPLAAAMVAVPMALAVSKHATALDPVLRPWWAPYAAGLLCSAWFFTVSFTRHAWFGSGSRDMGLFTQTLWLLSRFQSPENTLMGMNAFADHMELMDVLLAPSMWLWPDAGMLLLIQAVVVGSGAVPVFRMAAAKLGSPVAGALAAGAYFLSHQIGSGIMFDWNPTTVALGLFPWAMEAALLQRWRVMGACLLAVALCKENLLLYVVGFGLWLWTLGAPRRVWQTTVLAPAVGFVVEMKLLFPLFRTGGFRHFYFGELGTDFADVMVNALVSPARALTLLVTPAYKLNGVFLPMSSTGWLALLSPAALLPAIPGVLERYWSTFQNSWWGHHYGGPTHAITVVAAVLGGARLGNRLCKLGALWDAPAVHSAVRLWPACVLFLATLAGSFLGPWGASDLFVLRKPYHPSAEDRATMSAAVASIPAGVPVAAQNYLVAHLAAREKIFELSRAQEATYVAMTPTTNPWPFDRGYHDRLAQQLLLSGWRIHFCEGQSFVLARDAGPSVPCAALER